MTELAAVENKAETLAHPDLLGSLTVLFDDRPPIHCSSWR